MNRVKALALHHRQHPDGAGGQPSQATTAHHSGCWTAVRARHATKMNTGNGARCVELAIDWVLSCSTESTPVGFAVGVSAMRLAPTRT